MSRPCSDHIAGYRLYYLSGEPGAEQVVVYHKGQGLPRDVTVLALPYRTDGTADGTAAALAVLRAAQHGGRDVPDDALPAGAVLCAAADGGPLRVVATAHAPGPADPGYVPAPPGELLGHLRTRTMLSVQEVAERATLAEILAATAEAECSAWLATFRPVGDPDAFTRQLLDDAMRDAAPSVGALEAELDALAARTGTLTDDEVRRLGALQRDWAELVVASRYGVPRSTFRVPPWDAAHPDTFANPFLTDPAALAGAPDRYGTLTELHLLSVAAGIVDRYGRVVERAPAELYALSADRTVREASERELECDHERGRLVEALLDERFRDRDRDLDWYFTGGEEPTWTMIPVVGGDTPTRFEHGCVYVVVDCNWTYGPEPPGNLIPCLAYPTRAAAIAALPGIAEAVAEGRPFDPIPVGSPSVQAAVRAGALTSPAGVPLDSPYVPEGGSLHVAPRETWGAVTARASGHLGPILAELELRWDGGTDVGSTFTVMAVPVTPTGVPESMPR